MARTDKGKKNKKDKKDKKRVAREKEQTKKQAKEALHAEGKVEKKSKKGKKSKEGKGDGEESALARLSRRIGKGDRLADLKCVPCRGGVPPLTANEIEALLPRVSGWRAIDGHHLEREFKFPDFAQALDFTIEVGEVAEKEQHHPDVYLAWGKVGVKIWTHKIDGLTESDFVLAAKIDELI
jgi:4a-hydroxytetrahydrobiopterin dehydratase